ncbi:Pyridoxamine 5'-phosphate oxidase putative domain-containing protein OS=Streptomyces antimycoticus OX=68175 GN=SSPO_038760 PE=4 SV=1 [Streptomyces antimycoticus]
MTQTPMDRALVEEAAKKSALIWVQGTEGAPRALWHIWHEGAVCLVGDGPREQPLQGLGLADGGSATVTVRSKDKGGRLVGWPARVVELAPGGEAWTAVVDELKGKRLNAPDADHIAERWARECRVLRLEPAPGALAEHPTGSLAADPAAVPGDHPPADPGGAPEAPRPPQEARPWRP